MATDWQQIGKITNQQAQLNGKCGGRLLHYRHI
jgi:hypothetical protein